MGLPERYNGVFVRLDEDCISILILCTYTVHTMNMYIERLNPFDTYIAYGYISNKTVSELVHRRAYIFDGETRKALSDNISVEKKLGHLDILCLNDLSQQIYNVGPHFDEAIKIFATFKLSSPVGNYEKSILKKSDEAEAQGGFLGEEMETYLNKIL